MMRSEAHLLLGAIRVLAHQSGRSPKPEEIADLIGASGSQVRLQLAALEGIGAVTLVNSAFETHVEIQDYLAVEQFDDESGPAINDDLRAFDQRKREEAERMAHLFDSGESEQQKQDQLKRMDENLRDYRRRKPPNPFGDG